MADVHRQRELRMVLLGKVGAGKSASGNTLLGTSCFSSILSARPVTQQCEAHSKKVGGRWLTVVDTPGLTAQMIRDTAKEKLLQCLQLSAPGPHVFLFVIRLDRFTQEEQDTVQRAVEVFGLRLYMFTIILFTLKDRLKNEPVEEYISTAGESLKQLLQKCGNRYHAFNNNNPCEEDQAEQLLVKVDRLVAANCGRCYTTKDCDLVPARLMQQNLYTHTEDSRIVSGSHSLGATAEDVVGKEEDLHVKIQDLICKLSLHDFYPYKLTTGRALNISRTSSHREDPLSEKDVVSVYLNKLFRSDYGARYVTFAKDCVTDEMEKNVDEDFNDFLYEDNKHNSCENNQIHPMDVQMAVFYCADSFLSQNMVTKLSSCQYALPLMVPNPTSADIELPLWTFQQIKKTWRSVDGCDLALPVCQLETPMVFFCRLGSVTASKSQLLNSLINTRHDTFFHRDSPCSSRSRLLINGLVEIAWYCPAGQADDHFRECTAFCNLHGDAVEHRKQTDFLTEQSTVNIVLMQNMKLNDEAKELLQKLHSSSKPLICVVCDLQKGPLKIAKGYNVKLGLNGRNKAQLHKEMITAVEICLQKCNTFSLEKISEVAKCSGFRVNECNETLISKLNLSAFFPNKLTDADVLSMKMASFQSEDPQTEKDLVSLYLCKLFTLDYRSRSITLKLNTKTQKSVTDEPDDFFDFFSDFQCEKDEDTHIHPMDIQMSVFYCADSFLRQNMVTKLSTCQYALPLLVPSPTSTDIEFPLWTFREIKKTWKSVGDSSISLPVCQVKAPMVFFCRLGSVSTSKSQLLNSLINPKHDTFFHRNSQGSSKSRIFMDGMVEIAWYFPAGNTDDHFGECTAFCNLHGDGVEHRKQTEFLTEQATVNIVLVQNMKLNDEAKEFLKKLFSDSSKHLICVVNDLQKSPLTILSGNNIKIGLRDRNQAELNNELIEAVRMCLQKCKSSPTFNLEESSELAKHCGFRVDEDSEDCQEGKNAALKVMELLKGEDISQIKAKFLPCQGKLWHEWSWKNKQLYRLYGEVEQTKSKIQQEMHSIRNQQRKRSCNRFIKAVHENLNSMSITEKTYFVTWLKIYLDGTFSEQLSEVTQQYYKQLSEVYLLKQKEKMTEEKQEQLERLSEKVDAMTLGLEHIVREMGQLYEAWSAKPEEMNPGVSALAAVLLISGNPLELMDGDAAHVPLTWIESVLDKVIERLGDQRVFVLSVLGLQSSGKSTMLNTMFGPQFAVSAGRCTKGAFMQLIRVKEEAKEELKFDYILVVDTEGLQSLQLVSKQSALAHDNELATFVTGLADLTLINIFGENPAEMQNIIQIVVQAFLRMKKVRLTPSCMFVHQNVTDISAGEKNMEVRRQLQEKLDQMTCLAAAEEVVSAECFNDVIKFDIQTDVHYIPQLLEGYPPMAPPNPRYSENVQKLKQAILRSAAWKKSLRISEFKVHIKDLWTAVLNEDFVFSFKNTLEISAYRKLEVMYGKWTWKLREKMLVIQNKLQNLIENGKLVHVDQKQIHEEMSDTFCTVKKEMETFFTEARDAEILSQWNVRTEFRIADVHDSLCKATEVKMNELRELKETCKMLDDRKRQYENEMFHKSKELASRLKGKAADEQELQKEFETMWKKWLLNLRMEVPLIKDVSIEQEVMNMLSSSFERRAVYSRKQSHDFKQIYDKGTYSEYVIVKKKIVFSHRLNSEDHDSVRELVQQTVRKAEEIIRNEAVAKTGYSDTYTQEILNCVMEKVKWFESKKFRLRNEFSVDLSLYICDTAVKKFTELHRVFREANDPLIYLEMKEADFFSIFRRQCEGATATTVFADFVCSKLKPSIIQAACDQAMIDATTEMKDNFPAFNGNRSKLKKHILLDLAEAENFDWFITYIKNPKKHFSDFIRRKFQEQMFEGENPRILQILKNAVEKKHRKLSKIIQKVTQEIKQLKEWLERFSQELECEMKFSVNDLKGAQYQDITDTVFFGEVLDKALQTVFKSVKASFDHISSVRMDMFRQRPEDILMKQLCGCWVQCPFCKAVCTNTMEGHDEDHSVPFHRPEGVNGLGWNKTDCLSVDVCTSLVASDAYIYTSDGRRVPYRNYKSAGPEYACWSITPDCSEQPYWKWVVCHFQKDLEKFYGKTFKGRGQIPASWRHISKREAIQSLDFW